MKKLDIQDFINYRFPFELCASPDKRRCAFTVSRPNLEKNRYDYTLYLFDRETRGVTQLTHMGAERGIVWLDDSTLLFNSVRDEEFKKKQDSGESLSIYYAINLFGGEAYEYMQIPMDVVWMRPIGKDRFAVLAKYWMEERTKQQKEDYIVADELPFRQDGMGITNGMRFRVYVFDRLSSALTPVSEPERNVEFINVEGSCIIYSGRRFYKNSAYEFTGGIAVYDADTGVNTEYVQDDIYRVYHCGFINGTPFFIGSDGKRFGYQENSKFYIINSKGREEIFYDNNGSTSNAVLTDSCYGNSDTTAVDDEYVYYVSTEGCNSYIKRVGTNGIHESLSIEDGAVQGIAPCGDEVIFIAMRDNMLPELYSIKDGKECRITELNIDISEEYSLSAPKYVKFINDDGIMIEGYVIEPVNFKRGESYPGILYMHGGHKLTFGPLFYHEMQVWANRGFFVFYCNPQGSNGRGDEFADVIGRYGFVEFGDLMKFTDTCLDLYPEIDADRLGVGGGSYGGFLTNWIIGNTNRFKAAVSQRGISNYISMFGSSDTGYLFPLWQFKCNIWMDIERYWDHSPLKYTENCITPTLFIHSENDYRCPVTESIQMFTALQYNGVESRLCIFNGESHGLSRSGRPRNRINRLKEITDWFEKYLK